MKEVTKDLMSTTRAIDGFEGFQDAVEGQEERSPSNRVIQGALVKFTNEGMWVTREGEEISPNLELVAFNIGRVVQRWKDQEPIETIVLEPGQKFPDLEKLNAAVPQSEWVEGPDEPRGPYQAQYLVYLIDLQTMNRYTFATGTAGGGIAVRELRDKTMWMRRFRGSNVYAVVTLSDIFMNTRFGGRQRPHFIIKRWIALGDGGPAEQLAVPDRSKVVESPNLVAESPDQFAAGDTTQTVEKPVEKPIAQTVEKPSAKEVTGDEIQF
jgi:hypothetical protein